MFLTLNAILASCEKLKDHRVINYEVKVCSVFLASEETTANNLVNIHPTLPCLKNILCHMYYLGLSKKQNLRKFYIYKWSVQKVSSHVI